MTEPAAVSTITAAEVGAIRAQIFLDGANEIAQIDKPGTGSLNKGLIAGPIDAIKSQLGRSIKDFAQRDKRVISLLIDAVTEVYGIKVRSSTHLYNFLKEKLVQTVWTMKREDRAKVERLIRRIAKGLTNGYSGTWL